MIFYSINVNRKIEYNVSGDFDKEENKKKKKKKTPTFLFNRIFALEKARGRILPIEGNVFHEKREKNFCSRNEKIKKNWIRANTSTPSPFSRRTMNRSKKGK